MNENDGLKGYSADDYEKSFENFDHEGMHKLTAQLYGLLAGKPPSMQGAAIADLFSMWIAGHHPKMRRVALAQTYDLVKQLLPQNVAILMEQGAPKGWDAEEPPLNS